jgi:hypothetical protein
MGVAKGAPRGLSATKQGGRILGTHIPKSEGGSDEPIIITLTVAYFLVSSIVTFDNRMNQAKKQGNLPPDEPLPPAWVVTFYWA